jgi:hypothetical protein
MLFFVVANLLTFGICAAAVRYGERAERLGAFWLLANIVIQLVVAGGASISPTMRVLIDGVYATGLIPLAFFYVSWFIGLMALLECAAFTIQAFYLLQDIPSDRTLNLVSNTITAAVTVTLLASTVASCIYRRRLSRLDATAAMA